MEATDAVYHSKFLVFFNDRFCAKKKKPSDNDEILHQVFTFYISFETFYFLILLACRLLLAFNIVDTVF